MGKGYEPLIAQWLWRRLKHERSAYYSHIDIQTQVGTCHTGIGNVKITVGDVQLNPVTDGKLEAAFTLQSKVKLLSQIANVKGSIEHSGP